MPEIEEENISSNLQCSVGCLYNAQCVSAGIRTSDRYCSLGGDFTAQKNSKEFCENNFECMSNVCVDSACIEQGLFKRFIDWFSSLFG